MLFQQFRTSVFGSLIFGCLFLFFSGCGGTDFGPSGSLSGKLTLDGQPLPAGTKLVFMQIEPGYAAYAMTEADGSYDLVWVREGVSRSEVPVGKYNILVQPANTVNVEDLDAEAMLGGQDSKIEAPPTAIPDRYREHKTSGLEFDIKEGENSFDINLTSGDA